MRWDVTSLVCCKKDRGEVVFYFGLATELKRVKKCQNLSVHTEVNMSIITLCTLRFRKFSPF